MFRFAVFFILFIFSTKSFSQNQNKFYGKVINSGSREALENVSVYIKDGNQGTFTNKEGNFIFSTDIKNGTLVFQLIGFKPNEISIESALDELLILLDPDPFFLDEVVVEADSSLTILTEAFSRLRKNYPNKQHLLKGYYRESVLKDDSYVRFLDAAIGINDFSYHSDPLKRKIQVYNLRKSENFVEENLITKIFSKLFRKSNDFLINLNLYDILRRYFKNPSFFKGMNKDLLDFFDFKMDSILMNGGEPIAKIEFSAATMMYDTNGHFYVNLNDFAIVRFEVSRVFSNRISNDSTWKKASEMNALIEYRKINDKYFLSKFESVGPENFDALDINNKTGFQVLKMELWINEFFDNKKFFDKVKNKNKINWETKLEDINVSYDAEFWKKFNFVPDSMEYEKMIKDLEILKASK